ncbi:ComEA family DNA-binding protein [Methylobacterium pseudosasicola]|uniref:Helix-hairpin-helix motif-containing protein n=1 Tax=Methylobacterium pseudosasicola TaxID=582667 RepID=A0A1I4NGJ6_9HYPH|nr:helix-hairpin-helix domain-containing protein [Methylobacterium pseudosasicola]SFM14427.1 Helix-hairpin-helix motif-containing protein [Methylobacterium pseudosasicola]
MLSGPAILRISVILILAGILAALVQFLLPSPSRAPAPDPAPVAEAPSTPPEPIAPPAPPPAPEPVAPQPPGTAASRPAQMPSDALAFPSEPVQQGQAEIDQAEDNAGPRAIALLDLNTASVADLNKLRGGGAIGRAITAKRPYTSVDQLLSKRVLSRAVYEKIKDQVTVR